VAFTESGGDESFYLGLRLLLEEVLGLGGGGIG
jgi:hypothetical protein